MKILFFLVVFIFLFPSPTFAESSYVLPYPSSMPGSFVYKFRGVEEALLPYWYFGNISSFIYNLKQSDKYLVEAKTLFEYKQYLLGYRALEKSDMYYKNSYPYLKKAKTAGDNISDKLALFREATLEHEEQLASMHEMTPSRVLWSPEKALPTDLLLHRAIEESIALRKSYL